MRRHTWVFSAILSFVLSLFFLVPGATAEILIGMEYVRSGIARPLAGIGAPAVKYLPDAYSWGKMQRSARAAIDFTVTDRFVAEFQQAGFTDLVLALKSHSAWASKDGLDNPSPKPEHLNAYAAWVKAVVERYDADGTDDMPGLLRPVRYVEIGVEFSSYEPEPVDQYIEMLGRAYGAAHEASDDVIICHVAFFGSRYLNGEFDRGNEHTLADHYAILDRPDIFDCLNIHALLDPYEIELTKAWLDNATQARGYTKPVIISDTLPNPLMGLGWATTCTAPASAAGLIVPPATEADRCRLAAFFKKLVAGDKNTLRWTQGFIAADMVQRVVIAAEQGFALIDTAFTEDLPSFFKARWFRASAGITPWAGMLKKGFFGSYEYRPNYYAQKQLVGHLKGYDNITRIEYPDERARVYLVEKGGEKKWICWLDPQKLLLPGDTEPQVEVTIATGKQTVTIEKTITVFGQTEPETTTVQTDGGAAALTLTSAPVYVY
jgi:hypothetical protein